MAKLVLRPEPPFPDPNTFQNHTAKMTREEKAVLALRGFACGASMIIPTYHLWHAANETPDSTDSPPDYPQIVMRRYMQESMLDHLLVQVRRLFDHHQTSLAAGTIASLLDDQNIREFLVKRALGTTPRVAIDPQRIQDHLILAQRLCSLCLVKERSELPSDAPPLQVRAFLARRMANKRSAHMTLDDYQISRSDIRDLCFNILIIARALQRVHGEDLYSGNYAEVDRGSYEAASRIFSHRHTQGLLTSDLEENIDMHINRIYGTRVT